MLWSPAGEGKRLDLIFPSLGKKCCQQLAGTHESVTEDELHLSSLRKGLFFVYTHICSHPHTYTNTHVHAYIHTYIYMKMAIKSSVCVLDAQSCLFAIQWTLAHQTPLSMGFSRQEYWSELPVHSPGDLPNPGIQPTSPALQADSLLSEPPGKPI